MDWNKLNGIRNVEKINSNECWTNYTPFWILVNAFHWIQVASFQSNPLLDTNQFFLIPLTGIRNETKPMRFNAVRWLSNWIRVNAFCGIQIEKGQCDFMLLGDYKIRFQSMRFEELKLEDSDYDWMPPKNLKIKCQLMPLVELNVLNFNSYITLLEFSFKM